MKIVIGVDESPYSWAAVQFVKRGPWAPGSSLRVVAASPPVILGAGEAAAPAAIMEIIRQQDSAARELAERASAELRGSGLEVTPVMLPGDPRSALIDEARQEHADLIVVGSHGRSGLSKLLLGSVASHVVAHAPCSVLVVKAPHP